MNVKRIVIVSLITFLIGGIGGGALAYMNHPINGGRGGNSLTDDLRQAQAEQEVQKFIAEQEEMRPDGLTESKIETGSKYTGITYNGENNGVVIATPQKEQGNIEVTVVEPVKTPAEKPSVNKLAEDKKNGSDNKETKKGRVIIQEGSLNIRAQANKDNDNIIGQVYKDDQVEILGKTGAWYKIKTADGLQGYVSVDYVKEIK